MDYTQFFHKTLTDLGFDPVCVWNAFIPPHTNEVAWPLNLPDVEFKDNTILFFNFQDWITYRDGKYVELEMLEQRYKDNLDRILVATWHHNLPKHYTGPIRTAEFSTHNVREIARIKTHDINWVNHPKQSKWQCLNGRMCDHRLRAAQILKKWPNGILSYGNSILLPNWDYATYRGTENDENFQRLQYVYNTAQVNIVTETHYHYPSIITEKTLYAAIAKQIPILIGYQGMVRDCEEWGLDMFRDIVDTSYDDLPDSERVEQALYRNKDLIIGNKTIPNIQNRLAANQRRILEGLPEYYCENFRSAAAEMAQKLLSV